jgi:hypothetical protein
MTFSSSGRTHGQSFLNSTDLIGADVFNG